MATVRSIIPIGSREESVIESLGHESGSVFKAGVITRREIIKSLPDHLVDWLHTGLDVSSPRLRLRGASNLLMDFEEAVVGRLFPLSDGRSFSRQLRRHCLVTAAAARVIATEVGFGPETMYVCGLLHELGMASAILHVDALTQLLNAQVFENSWPMLRRSSCQHAVWLATRWRLPSGVRFAIRDFTNYETATTPSLVASAMVVAEYWSTFVGFGFGPNVVSKLPLRGFDEAIAHLRLDRKKLADLVESTPLHIDRRQFGRDPSACLRAGRIATRSELEIRRSAG